SADCESEACKVAIAEGRTIHAVPFGYGVTLPRYHYSSRGEAIAALVVAAEEHPTFVNWAELRREASEAPRRTDAAGRPAELIAACVAILGERGVDPTAKPSDPVRVELIAMDAAALLTPPQTRVAISVTRDHAGMGEEVALTGTREDVAAFV